ncbi:hypothetical protein AAFN47_00445 [Hoeflea sp. CAU 1731]
MSVVLIIQLLYMNPIEQLSESIDVGMDREQVIAALDEFAESRDDKSSGWFGYRFRYNKDGDEFYIGYSNGFDGSNLFVNFNEINGKVISKSYIRD